MKNRLKELRKLHRRSQADLARELGVSRQAVNGFESGKFDPSLEMAFKLSGLFNVAIEDVFIYEAKNSMQALVERVKDFFGLDFGFERFTDKAINVIKFAQNKAVSVDESEVEPRHLLAGLLADPATLSAQLLLANGATTDTEIDEYSFEAERKVKLSASSKFVLEMALQVVRLQKKRLIGTEHLLWGLTQLADTDATIWKEMFEHYGINLNTLKAQLSEKV